MTCLRRYRAILITNIIVTSKFLSETKIKKLPSIWWFYLPFAVKNMTVAMRIYCMCLLNLVSDRQMIKSHFAKCQFCDYNLIDFTPRGKFISEFNANAIKFIGWKVSVFHKCNPVRQTNLISEGELSYFKKSYWFSEFVLESLWTNTRKEKLKYSSLKKCIQVHSTDLIECRFQHA